VQLGRFGHPDTAFQAAGSKGIPQENGCMEGSKNFINTTHRPKRETEGKNKSWAEEKENKKKTKGGKRKSYHWAAIGVSA